jgi:predicted transcriptional regulator
MTLQQDSMTKREIMKSLKALPEDATIEDFLEHLGLLIAVEEGLADLEAERVISHEDMVERVKQWLK